MSFLSKLFGKSSKATEPKQAFEIIDFELNLNQDNTIEVGEDCDITLTYRSQHACQIWIRPFDEDKEEYVDATYSGAAMLEAGKHTLERDFMLTDMPENGRVNHLLVIVQQENGDSLRVLLPINCRVIPNQDPDFAERQQDGVGNTGMSHEISLFYRDTLLPINEKHTLPLHKSIEVLIPYQTHAQEGLRVWAFPVFQEGETALDCCYEASECHQLEEGYTHQPVVLTSFSVSEAGAVKHIQIVMNNESGQTVFTQTVEVDLQFVDSHNDGVGTAQISNVRYLLDDEPLQAGQTISEDDTLELILDYQHQAQHGILLRVFQIVDGQLDEEEIATSAWLHETDRRDFHFEIDLSAYDAAISGLMIVMTNSTDEVLTQYLVDCPITVVED